MPRDAGLLREELELQRERDPVQKEMLRNREALADATAAERETVESLIETKQREAAIEETRQEQRDAFTGGAYDAIRGLVLEGEKLSDVMDNVANAILNAVLQATLLGEMPLAKLLGGAGGGGLLGALASALFPSAAGKPAAIPARAGGGMIYGPGDGTSDDILMWGSSGEMMMNAKAVRANRHLLEAMNAGNPIPALARGGVIGGAGPGGSAFGGVQVTIDNRGSTPVKGDVHEERGPSGQRQFRLVLADKVGQALGTKGGGARRTLRSGFGVKPRGTIR